MTRIYQQTTIVIAWLGLEGEQKTGRAVQKLKQLSRLLKVANLKAVEILHAVPVTHRLA